jgi:predicted nucleotidyltransferase component of viral defense system
MTPRYLATARLLTQVAPFVFFDDTFALKGGTAINLFLRDMPRLSVDLDLIFPDYRLPRAQALTRIGAALRDSADRLVRRGFEAQPIQAAGGDETKLIVRRDGIAVKIEVNTVMRGTVHPVRMASLTPYAQETLSADLTIPVASVADVYGGKLVAAMDRQHPRDLFDVMQLVRNDGITPAIRRAFVVYLASHNRPIHEVLFPTLRDVRLDYENNFVGMTVDPVALDDLLATRTDMVETLQQTLDHAERRFLLSLAAADPEWSILEIPHLEQLPAIRWKLQNLRTLQRQNPGKFTEQGAVLARSLEA